MGKTLPSTIQLTQNAQCDDCFIYADESQIQSMLMNIVGNAADAIGKSVGKIDITLSQCDIKGGDAGKTATMPPGPYAKLAVRDTGHGMDEETLAHIFDPFYTTKEVGSGTGLGLASAWGIAQSHDGYIIPTSKMGAGTLIEVYLPFIKDSQGEKVGGAAG